MFQKKKKLNKIKTPSIESATLKSGEVAQKKLSFGKKQYRGNELWKGTLRHGNEKQTYKKIVINTYTLS